MSEIADKSFDLRRTKSGATWHIVKDDGRSWCNHELVGKTLEDVPFGELMDYEICKVCLDVMTFAAVS
jgi:hypothetical protein